MELPGEAALEVAQYDPDILFLKICIAPDDVQNRGHKLLSLINVANAQFTKVAQQLDLDGITHRIRIPAELNIAAQDHTVLMLDVRVG